MDRHCVQCGTSHPLTPKHWFRLDRSPMCKTYYSERRKEYYAKNKEKEKSKHKEYVIVNSQKVAEYQKNYRAENRQLLNSKSTSRKQTDVQYRISCNLRSRLTKAFKERHGVSSIRHLGCSIPEFRLHLESKFQPGMTWGNYGAWHVDHVFPLSRADLTSEEDLKRVCNYTNLQPMWAVENIKKGNRINVQNS